MDLCEANSIMRKTLNIEAFIETDIAGTPALLLYVNGVQVSFKRKPGGNQTAFIGYCKFSMTLPTAMTTKPFEIS
jgi:hypothetical protein